MEVHELVGRLANVVYIPPLIYLIVYMFYTLFKIPSYFKLIIMTNKLRGVILRKNDGNDSKIIASGFYDCKRDKLLKLYKLNCKFLYESETIDNIDLIKEIISTIQIHFDYNEYTENLPLYVEYYEHDTKVYYITDQNTPLIDTNKWKLIKALILKQNLKEVYISIAILVFCIQLWFYNTIYSYILL